MPSPQSLTFALALGCLLSITAPGAAQTTPADTPRVAMPLMRHVPVIDGEIHEDEWADAVRNEGLVGLTGTLYRRGAFWVGCDGEHLFIALKTETAPGGDILARVVPDGDRDLRTAFQDDSIELVLDPKRGRPAGQDRTYYHILVNARGAIMDSSIDPDDTANPSSFGWRIPEWSYVNRVIGDWWHIEIAIPLTSLGATLDDLKTPWGVRIARNWKRPYMQSQWESARGNYNYQNTMPVVAWDPEAPVVQVTQLFDEADTSASRIRVSLRNPHDKPLTVKAHLSDAWHDDQIQTLDQTIAIPAGQTVTLDHSAPSGGEAGLHRTVINITDPSGEKTYYFRDYRWSLHRPEPAWTIQEQARKAVDLKHKYYPYHNKLRLRVDLSSLDARDQVRGATAAIRRVDRLGHLEERTFWTTKLTFDEYVSEGIYDIPDFNDGRYRILVTLEGDEDAKAALPEAITSEFTRTHYEWERNQLGISDTVMPPFTPMTVEGTTVGTVLREHDHAPGGLWRSVISQGREVLAAPMRWEVVLDGNEEPAALVAEPWRSTAASDTAVTGESAWHAGPVNATVRTEYDYDGMMLVRLAIEPTGDAGVSRLSVVIPLVDAETPYMHAVADGLRHNYAGATPAGDGKVWDSSQGNRRELVGTFFPFLWLGKPQRGLCWFADTDEDWRLDDQTPVLDLTREAGVLYLRVHLVTETGPITRRREIVFGLQATPTKPMPDGWRRWTIHAGPQHPDNPTNRVYWIGHSAYAGMLYYLLYPIDRRYEMFEKIAEARRTGEVDEAFLERWDDVIDQVFPRGSANFKRHSTHARSGLQRAAKFRMDDPVRFFFYSNAHGVNYLTREFETFQDEWVRYNWFEHNWAPPGRIAYDINPSDSFVDYAVWHYRRMLDCMDGIYWDNIYLSPHFDPVVGGAWTDRQGRVHPTLGILRNRELLKRTAIMHWQEAAARGTPDNRLPYIQLAHMTNATVVPSLSFINCTMDWEWKFHQGDWQDRFPADLILATATGRQVGAFPTCLNGEQGGQVTPEKEWHFRTRFGVCTVHEIRYFDYRPQWAFDLYDQLYAFGYGADDCRVFNYWDDTHPARVVSDTLDGKTLVLARRGKAIVLVTDFGEGGEGVLELDVDAMGIASDVSAVNMETGEAIGKLGPGRFRIALKKHDFVLMKLE